MEGKHTLIPKHEKLSDDQKQKLFEEYNITLRELPQISIKDPALEEIEVAVGDVIKITRSSPTAGTTHFYRGVSND